MARTHAKQFKPGAPKPPNSGRKAGTPNKRTAEFLATVEAICERYDVHPIEAMAKILRDANDDSLRFQAAKELAGYMYAKRRSPIELTGRDGAGLEVNVGDQTGLVEAFKDALTKFSKEG